jgi:hypothetical protein
MEYLQAAKALCARLIVGITNPDLGSITHHATDPKRSTSEANPLSYFERYEMIDDALLANGWAHRSFSIVPADVADLSKISAFLPAPSLTTVFVTIYDAWGEEKARRMEDLGYSVDILWRRQMSERFTTGSEVRRRVREGESWEQLVPEGVAPHLRRLLPSGHEADEHPVL